MREGCPNCDHVLGLKGNNDAIQECTSQVFEGLITVRDPVTSWVARWQRLDSYVPGTYAVKVTGSVSYTQFKQDQDQSGLGWDGLPGYGWIKLMYASCLVVTASR